jgi:uncharacterized protein
MKLLFSNLPKAVIDHRKTVILLSVLFLVVASWKIPSLQFESGVEIWFKKDSSVLHDYQLTEKLFGVSNTMVVSYERQNSDEEKTFLENFTKDMVKHEGVESVDSLLAVEGDVRFKVKYLSKNERYGLINLELKLTKENNHKVLGEVLKSVEHWFEENHKGLDYHLSGVALNGRLYANSAHDRALVAPLFIVLVPLLLFVLFRCIVCSVVIFPVILFAGAGSLGFTAWIGWTMNILNSVLLLIIMTVTVAGSVHVFADFFRHQRLKNSREAAIESIRELMFPCFITSLTTALGFYSLALTTELKPLLEFGVCAGTGVLLAFLGIMFLLPALLSFAQIKEQKMFREKGVWLKRMSLIKPRTGLLLSLLLIGLFAGGLWCGSKLNADSSMKNFFREGSTGDQAIQHFEAQYGGLVSIDLIVQSSTSYSMKDFEKLKKIHTALQENPLVEGVLTPYLLTFNRPVREGLSDNGKALQNHLLLKTADDRKINKIAEDVLSSLQKDFPEYEFTMTGKMILLSKMNNYITDGMLYSLSLSLVLITCCLLIFLRNLKDSFLAIMLSIIPVLCAAIIMYCLDMSLNLTSMIIAATCFSIAVDDSIHIVSRYRKVRQSFERQEALTLTLQQCGLPVIYTSIILALGFGLNFLGHHQPTREFGILGCTIIVMAVVTDIIGFTAFHKAQSFFQKKPKDQ